MKTNCFGGRAGFAYMLVFLVICAVRNIFRKRGVPNEH
jgi:hypothetical protein